MKMQFLVMYLAPGESVGGGDDDLDIDPEDIETGDDLEEGEPEAETDLEPTDDALEEELIDEEEVDDDL